MPSLLGENVGNSTFQWQPEPLERGTFSILSTCITTMLLCVWSALHLNVPEHDRGGWLRLWNKIQWLFLGLVFPEVVRVVSAPLSSQPP